MLRNSPKLLILSLFLSLLASCSSPESPYPGELFLRASYEGKDIIVFVPGFKGSELREEQSGEKVWLTASEVLFGEKTLQKESATATQARRGKNLVPGAVLSEVSIIPGMYVKDVYGETIESLEHVSNSSVVIPFPYDWRESNHKGAAKLASLLSILNLKNPRSINIVAHSMGGLLTAYALRYGGQDPETAVETWEARELVDRVVFAGVPFSGTVTMYRDFHTGVTTATNRSLLNSSALLSFESAYQLLRAPHVDFVIDAQGRHQSIDIYDPETWKKYLWGPHRSKPEAPKEDLLEREQKFFESALRLAKAFNEKLFAPIQNIPQESLPILSIVGTGNRTVKKAIQVTQNSLPTLLFFPSEVQGAGLTIEEDRYIGDGDGVVLEVSTELPAAYDEAFEVESLQVDSNHRTLFLATESKKRIREFLEHSTR